MSVNVLHCAEINQWHTSVDCMYNCVAMSITYSLVVATGAFQCLCSDESTHASTLKQKVVPDSTASPAGPILA